MEKPDKRFKKTPYPKRVQRASSEDEKLEASEADADASADDAQPAENLVLYEILQVPKLASKEEIVR